MKKRLLKLIVSVIFILTIPLSMLIVSIVWVINGKLSPEKLMDKWADYIND